MLLLLLLSLPILNVYHFFSIHIDSIEILIHFTFRWTSPFTFEFHYTAMIARFTLYGCGFVAVVLWLELGYFELQIKSAKEEVFECLSHVCVDGPNRIHMLNAFARADDLWHWVGTNNDDDGWWRINVEPKLFFFFTEWLFSFVSFIVFYQLLMTNSAAQQAE